MRDRALILAVHLVLAAFIPGVAQAGDQRIGWPDGLGVVQPRAVVDTGSSAVMEGGAPWSTTEGHVEVDLDDGNVNFKVRGDMRVSLVIERHEAGVDGVVGAFSPECFEPDIAFLVRTASGAWLSFGAVRRR